MNGKKAKALRRQAREATEGQPAKAYLSKQYVTEKDFTFDKEGKKVKQRARITTTSVKLDPSSTRGTYRLMKKGKV